MRSHKRPVRAIISLLVGSLMALGPFAAASSASAQTRPSCPRGYYYASDGYCYPMQPPVYAYPPPAYDVAPPVYQPPPIADGVGIGIGLGLLFGALAHRGAEHREYRHPRRGGRRGHERY